MATNIYDPQGTDDLPLPSKDGTAAGAGDANPASNVIRDKLARIYAEEPDATQELAEAAESSHRSKHQEFMYKLSNSGKDLATIQTEWHQYYEKLPAAEKHTVWQEFYDSQSLLTRPAAGQDDTSQALARHKSQAASSGRHSAARKKPAKLRDARNPAEIKSAIRDTVTAGGKLEAKHHLQSLLFGLGMGFVVLLIFLFGFFNEVFISPFIQPSRTSAATPLIVNSNSVAPTDQPEIIIPKINVEIPVDYTQTTTNEATIEAALENGIVHYPTTSKPGQNGNAAFFGHSSNNIFNRGKYKFAFVLLHTLVPGDTFYLTSGGKVYVYKVITKTVVEPSQVEVLDPIAGKTATATLITCDPPGTSLRRLVVVGEQISPDPSGNIEGAAAAAVTSGAETSAGLPGNGPTLFGRFISSSAGKIITTVTVLAIIMLALRRLHKE